MTDHRAIPSIDSLRKRPAVAALERTHGVDATVQALRIAADGLRTSITQGSTGSAPLTPDEAATHIEVTVTRRLTTQARGSLLPVINATGVIVHTNLGRAPLAEAAVDRMARVARGYSTLELDLSRGTRGSRSDHAGPLLAALTGAEAAVVVNNNAAAVLLILTALAKGREVVISRGEQVEIGGGFRVPEVMAQSGATLREVGTTNRTRIADYTSAISDRTAAILRVHRSNFRMDGFVEQPSLQDLVQACTPLGVPVVEDRGSGSLTGSVRDEPPIQASVAAGAALVCFSGDKLLGGPQAGIIVGQRTLVDRIRTHPLMRALRVDKLTLAALEATLRVPPTPTARALAARQEDLLARADRIAESLRARGIDAVATRSPANVGGGGAPEVALDSAAVRLPESYAERLRLGPRPVVGRVAGGACLLDLLAVPEDVDESIVDAVVAATG